MTHRIATATLSAVGLALGLNAAPPNLIPETPNADAPNYVCTWACQDWYAHNRLKGQGLSPRDTLNHAQLFGENGWARTFFPGLRGDLIYLLDDGWDLPKGKHDTFGSLELSETKFPGYGDTPEERLKTLVRNVKAAGWKGCGVWICAQEKPGAETKEPNEAYWRERLRWSQAAGIAYWKIDWGRHSGNEAWRRMVSRLADEIHPTLVIEHITGSGPLNGADGRLGKRTIANNQRRAAFADVFRTYDVASPLSVPTTFERIGAQLAGATTDGKQRGLVCSEDEVYISCALGNTFGVMRYPIGDEPAGSLPNIFFGGADNAFTRTRPLRKMLDEVRRAVMWARIAPPFRADASPTLLSETPLTDTWTFAREDNWEDHSGKTLPQRAPAIIARGAPFPDVRPGAEGRPLPFVSLCRFPNGATAIGSYGRVSPKEGYRPAPACVTAAAGKPEAPIGVFGSFERLTLTFEAPVEGMTVWAQDLMGTAPAQDLTAHAVRKGNTLTLPGERLREVGLSAATEPHSEPGLVLSLRR